MNLGFYYHDPLEMTNDGRIGLPAFLAKFINSLAGEVTELVLFMHVEKTDVVPESFITATNVRVVSLGRVLPAYIRFYFSSCFVHPVKTELSKCDFLLVRSPSPLAPAFVNYLPLHKIVYMIVGSYKEGSKFLRLPLYKVWAVKLLNQHMHYCLGKAVRGGRILVNSTALLNEYVEIAKSIRLVNTTTLEADDFFFRNDTCQGTVVKLLFVARIDLAKGLLECIRVCHALNLKGITAILSIVGWELNGSKRVTSIANKLVLDLKLSDKVRFVGPKKAGPELFECYRTHDVYLLPSYHEGFPRTIWEALANGIPVVSTTVGSIPAFLKHKVEALLVPPQDVQSLTAAVECIIQNSELRRSLIENGYERVKDIRLNVQSKKILEFVKA